MGGGCDLRSRTRIQCRYDAFPDVTGQQSFSLAFLDGGDNGIIKRGLGVLLLGGANQYGGFTRVEGGSLWAADPQALGIAAADAGTGVLAGGRVVVLDTINFEPLIIEVAPALDSKNNRSKMPGQ